MVFLWDCAGKCLGLLAYVDCCRSRRWSWCGGWVCAYRITAGNSYRIIFISAVGVFAPVQLYINDGLGRGGPTLVWAH